MWKKIQERKWLSNRCCWKNWSFCPSQFTFGWRVRSKFVHTRIVVYVCVSVFFFLSSIHKKLLRMYMDGYALETITFSHKLHRKRGMLIHKYRLTLLGLFGNIEWLQCLHVWCKTLVNPFIWQCWCLYEMCACVCVHIYVWACGVFMGVWVRWLAAAYAHN